MIEIQHILCPVDFSETSRHAVEHARAIARWYESQVTLLHVIQKPLVMQPPIIGAVAAEAVGGTMVERRAQAAEELQRWLAPLREANIKADVVLDEGNAAGKILDFTASRGVDLIVMGTHGLGGFERFMLGSVAEKVLRKASCPVVTVPPASHTAAKVPYTRILCPIDFSESSLSALRYAFSLAKEADARLMIFHVAHWPPEDELLAQIDVPEYRRHLEEAARERVEALITEEARVWCKPVTKIGYGKPYREILQVAESERADLIVIGVRGRNALDMTVFGSTANQVVRRASCPVLTLRQ